MIKRFIILIAFFNLISPLTAQKPEPQYDESKVPAYKLPDPLILADGSPVKSKKDWEKRRAEILKIFENEVYGISPEWNGKVQAYELNVKKDALKGLAIRKDIRLTFKYGNKEHSVMVLLYLPRSQKPVPVFLGYNFNGNHTVTNEPDIPVTESWVRNNDGAGSVNNKASESGRGSSSSRWEVEEILKRGFGLVTLYYGDVDPDFDDGFSNGVHALYDQKMDAASWGTIAAWAWGLSRVMDWIETDPQIDPRKVIVMGHSRLGKAALWAGATDDRFAAVISNNSGCGGAALSNRKFGETVDAINKSFPHWFCDNFEKYNNKEENLPVDQHELLALIAPRPVYVASAQKDLWADPKGEFLSCVNASPVYKLLGTEGFPATEMPEVNSPVIGTIGYHIRTGEHDVTLYDWQQYMNFADLHLKKQK
jgi:hypothetical protein